METIKQVIEAASHADQPAIYFIKRAKTETNRLGVFASSFNPVTTAHLELMRQARVQFSLDEIVALAGMANADKSKYESSIEDRLTMLTLALENDAHYSIALSSHAFFVDKLDALASCYKTDTELHFILGFDTFERVLDREDKYTGLYSKTFQDRTEALEYLLTGSRLIVASRAGATYQAVTSLASELLSATQQARVWYLDFPTALGEQSATEVRERVRNHLSITGLVPEAVAHYIKERGLYG